MLQSWDNVANMHELFTVNSHTQRKSISLAVYQLLVQCACSSTNFEPMTTPLDASQQ